ncbi:MAG: succinate dehydrogenase, cytochrome b556 subunit [Gammaproteobacteria bacterium]
MNKKQVVYLNLFQFRFPITAIVSILHRVSGVVLFLCVPGVLWALQQSLASESAFTHLMAVKDCFPFLLGLWVFLSALFYHLVAGIRHIFMDFCIGDTKAGGRLGAYLVMIMSGIFTVLSGVVILW